MYSQEVIKKNIAAVYVIHPSNFSSTVIFLMRRFTSRKLRKKIHEIYNWKGLAEYIELSNIVLPDTSKDFITKAYDVVKVNSKGKHQERLIKFTSNSILNIDPKGTKIRNEKLFAEIVEISVLPSVPEIEMQFDSVRGKPDKYKLSIIDSIRNQIADQEFRRYVCTDIQTRDEIITDLFESAIKADSIGLPQEYEVIKVNKAGKHQDRTIKLTRDSLITLNASVIRSEISFAGIDYIKIDAENPQVVHMQYKSEKDPRKIICARANEMIEAVKQGMLRYGLAASNDDDDLKTADDEYEVI